MKSSANIERESGAQIAPTLRRRLSDKIQDAIHQAARQGRREIEKRLTLIYQATVEEETRDRHRRRYDDFR